MIFSLEALQAFHGDCLLLHAGKTLVLIDGGPANTYQRSLRPRLEQLRAAAGGQLRIDLAMLSHIDSDHIDGLNDLAAELLDLPATAPAPYDVRIMWHNTFDDILDNEADELSLATLAEAGTPAPDAASEKDRAAGRAVVASVPQGRTLRDRATSLGWSHNDPFDGLVAAPEQGARKIALDGGASLTVVCPQLTQLQGLRAEWDAWLVEKGKGQRGMVADFTDPSPSNQASIVVLAEAAGKRMLLCGDARGDHVLEGLADAGLAGAGGVAKLDLLKLPHHGSFHNVEPPFFERLPARHYLVSANGKDGNPDPATLDMLVASRDDDDFEIHLTNHTGKDDLELHLDDFVARQRAAGRTFKMSFRDPDALSLRIDLGDETP